MEMNVYVNVGSLVAPRGAVVSLQSGELNC
jgi:hypothetical protein